ncbi:MULTISPECIES: high-potential iron-sulfur protein [unclassified Halomonas]|uniref:high-potential iron-sulfur protein n=1 Tax=unclassified Halomonas TaxID=2609666 RepID=UPI0006DA8FCD|nr:MULTISPECIES: high-potential iron-sulfur protein [unclassified Halomonas]KPQ30788.1 MAG: high potential iron-sulfur protein [Halomonas sp. HL-93]SBR50379.1 High potential iron-sulfur protein [Halomonas sp. HL-93]SNY96822.1 High potential iron-sulfur protein [Halomonas sp. hl-4]
MANQSRRAFMRSSMLSLAALPLGAGILSKTAFAQELPRLDPSASNAQALNYVEDAADASDHPAYEEGQRCDNCMFYSADNEGCQLFPENSVEPAGWCQSWVEQG